MTVGVLWSHYITLLLSQAELVAVTIIFQKQTTTRLGWRFVMTVNNYPVEFNA